MILWTKYPPHLAYLLMTVSYIRKLNPQMTQYLFKRSQFIVSLGFNMADELQHLQMCSA